MLPENRLGREQLTRLRLFVGAEHGHVAQKPTKVECKGVLTVAEMNQFRGTGRRKTSVARVRLIPGEKGIVINGKTMQEYFGGREILSKIVEQPLVLTETLDKYQVIVNVYGGGNSGQAGAIRHGAARALILADETLRGALKEAGFLTRDSRMVERKKFGRRKARRSPQFSKR